MKKIIGCKLLLFIVIFSMFNLCLLFLSLLTSSKLLVGDVRLSGGSSHGIVSHAKTRVHFSSVSSVPSDVVNVSSSHVMVYVLYNTCTKLIKSGLSGDDLPEVDSDKLPHVYDVSGEIDVDKMGDVYDCVEDQNVYLVGSVPLSASYLSSNMYSTRRYILIHNPNDHAMLVQYTHTDVDNPFEYISWSMGTLGSISLFAMLPIIGLLTLCFCFLCFV